MNNKKLTDNKIIKALDESELFLQNRVKDGQPIKLSEYDVGKLRNISQACAKAYDEINQLQTEKENLKVENQSLRSAANSLKMHYEEAQAEIENLKNENFILRQKRANIFEITDAYGRGRSKAVKEFVERLKEKAGKMEMAYSGVIVRRDYTIDEEILDNLVKEMVGENNSDE